MAYLQVQISTTKQVATQNLLCTCVCVLYACAYVYTCNMCISTDCYGRMRYVCLLLFWLLNCTYRFFVMSCLYGTVSLIRVREWQFIRIVYYYLCSCHVHRTYLGLLMLELLGMYVYVCVCGHMYNWLLITAQSSAYHTKAKYKSSKHK